MARAEHPRSILAAGTAAPTSRSTPPVREPGPLEIEDLERYAASLGLDTRRFLSELSDRVHAPHVHEDFRSGILSGVNGTPTFFINGAPQRRLRPGNPGRGHRGCDRIPMTRRESREAAMDVRERDRRYIARESPAEGVQVAALGGELRLRPPRQEGHRLHVGVVRRQPRLGRPGGPRGDPRVRRPRLRPPRLPVPPVGRAGRDARRDHARGDEEVLPGHGRVGGRRDRVAGRDGRHGPQGVRLPRRLLPRQHDRDPELGGSEDRGRFPELPSPLPRVVPPLDDRAAERVERPADSVPGTHHRPGGARQGLDILEACLVEGVR